jgi:tetratricopeptide (TPR) repeat protein
MNVNQSIDTLFKKCNKALNDGNCTQAYSFLQQVYQLLLRIPKSHILWVYYYINLASVNLASVYNNMGRFLESIDCCQSAEQIIPLKGNDDLKAKIESCRATSYLNISDYPNSIESVKKAIRLYNKINMKENAALELITYGNIQLRIGKWDQAIQKYSEALFIAKKKKNKRLEGKTLMELGFLFRGHRFLCLAVDHFREAERVFKELNFNQGLVMALYERANTYLSLKMTKETNALIKQIEALTPPDSTMRSFLYNLRYCLHNQNKNFPEAMDCANLLLDFFKNSQKQWTVPIYYWISSKRLMIKGEKLRVLKR